MLKVFLIIVVFIRVVTAQTYVPSSEQSAGLPREFRAAWVASVYNIDWPSRKGLGVDRQQAEMRSILDRLASMRMNAIILQIRPNADALYQSRLEPWSHWLSGVQGRSPGYDPLAYCIQQAHARGIEVHAWFNPFRALPSKAIPTAGNHVVKSHPSIIRNFKTSQWMDPSSSLTQKRALSVIMDVVTRYDIDGVHIDDYFYPYPDVDEQGRAKQIFPDGKSPAARRRAVDSFVEKMYSSIKAKKSWMRVGISPFGIWRPGVPAGTTARIDAFHHLSADSRKWLQRGWCDYFSPQLYWRINSEQSYSRLLAWWRAQGSRPVWPGISSARINSSEDPGRPVSEIVNQVSLSRSVGRNYVGHVFWSMKSLMNNRGGVNGALMKNFYQEPALVPPMPWVSQKKPATPNVRAQVVGGNVSIAWSAVPNCQKYAVQTRRGRAWQMAAVTSGTKITLKGTPDAIAITAVDRHGSAGVARVMGRQ